LGKRPSLFHAVPVLPRQISHSVSIKSKPASLSAPCDGGSFSRGAGNSVPVESSVRSGCFCDGIDDLFVEQQPSVVRELVADLAGVVHRFVGTARTKKLNEIE